MDIAHLIAEERIKEAMKNGEFDNLPGTGKPLKLEDLSHIPAELRPAYRMMKNAGMVPEDAHLKKEMVTLEQLIHYCQDEQERKKLEKQLTEKTLRFNKLIEKKGMTNSSAYRTYQQKIHQKFF